MVRLADFWEMLELLMHRRKWAEEVFLSILATDSPLSELLHLLTHACFISEVQLHFMAEGLMVSLRFRITSSMLLSECKPSAAFFASLSASLFPGMPE